MAIKKSLGFTLLELLVVVAIIALGTAGAALALRDSNQTALEREATRLAALFDAARSQSQATGNAVVWEVNADVANAAALPAMVWRGLRHKEPLPTQWLNPQTQVLQTRRLVLGPDPIMLPVRVQLALGSERMAVVSDGVAAFTIERL